MDQFELLQERANDALCQTRCDRRSLATAAKALYKKGYMPTSTSQLLRLIIEYCRHILVEEGAIDILSYEDADRILYAFGVKSLNAGGRQMSTYIRQRGKEELFLDGTPIDYATAPKATKKMMETKKRNIENAAKALLESGEAKKIFDESYRTDPREREFRKPDNIESPEQAEQRRQQDLKNTKAALATVPADIITDNNSDSDKNDDSASGAENES